MIDYIKSKRNSALNRSATGAALIEDMYFLIRLLQIDWHIDQVNDTCPCTSSDTEKI